MKDEKTISRRSFLRTMGTAGAVSAGLAACGRGGDPSAGGVEVPSGGMTRRTLTGDNVSLLGYGCMRWPMKPAPDGKGEVVDQEAVNALVDYALAHGVNYFDTAPPYCQGLSEEATGIALSRHPRDSYYIATKMSNHRHYAAGLRGKELYDASVRMYEDSFRNLRTDYIDYYLFHILGSGAGMEEMKGRLYDSGVADFVLKEYEKGRIRKLGFSFHGDVRVFDYMLQESGIKWDFVQIQLNYLDWRHATGRNVDAEHLQDNLRTYSPLKPLTDEEFAFLQETADLMMQYQTIPCNDCKYCMPCPYGLDIPGVLLHYNKCINEGNMPRSEGDGNYRKARRAFLVGYDRSVPRLRQADHCIGCGQCNPHCPQGIDIPKEMQRIDHFVEQLRQTD